MFEVVKSYEFRVIEGGDGEVMFWGGIERYEHPLIKLKDVEEFEIRFTLGPPEAPDCAEREGDRARMPAIPGRIINVTSPNFISAVARNPRA